MGIILLVLLLALILGGLGFAVHVLWWIALVVLVVWLLGFVVRAGEGAGRGRWYRWLRADQFRSCSRAMASASSALFIRERPRTPIRAARRISSSRELPK